MSEAEWVPVSLHSKKKDFINKSEQYNSIKGTAEWESGFLIIPKLASTALIISEDYYF